MLIALLRLPLTTRGGELETPGRTPLQPWAWLGDNSCVPVMALPTNLMLVRAAV